MSRDRQLIEEITFRTSRSSGKGGQNVNKVETRVEAVLDVTNSQALNEAEKQMMAVRLRSRISNEGLLAVACQESRSQVHNKKLAVEALLQLVHKALTVPKRRLATKVSEGAKRQRLQDKRALKEKKSGRRFTPPSD
jgi:ribosome-associated protein